MLLLKPERISLVKYLRKEKKAVFSHLAKALNRSPVSLNNEFEAVIQIPPGHHKQRNQPQPWCLQGNLIQSG